MRRTTVLLCLVLGGLMGAQSGRYRQLCRVIDRNTGFAHMTRGVNAYTLYALRSCVDQNDLPTLGDMLRDKDRIARMAAASVLADLGSKGRTLVQARLAEVKDASEKLMLQDALDDTARPGYRPILQYPLTDQERARIHGCRP